MATVASLTIYDLAKREAEALNLEEGFCRICGFDVSALAAYGASLRAHQNMHARKLEHYVNRG